MNNAACGVAAVTMVLDYYLEQNAPPNGRVDIATVAAYVDEERIYGRWSGSGLDDVSSGVVAASEAASVGLPAPLSVGEGWVSAGASTWFDALRSQVSKGHPVIVFIPNGENLGWRWGNPIGHFIVVSGYTTDRSIIYHDPWGGVVHTISSSAFASAWGTGWSLNPPWQFLAVQKAAPVLPPVATPTPTPRGAERPGGEWLLPAAGSEVGNANVHFQALAYPSKPAQPLISKVVFTVWWPGLGPKSGAWRVACQTTDATHGNVYECQGDLARLGAPKGQIWVSFDVYDNAGNMNRAPNGERTITYGRDVSGISAAWLTCGKQLFTSGAARFDDRSGYERVASVDQARRSR